MNYSSWKGRALSAATLALSLGACDFITASEGNPNAVPDATVDQLFVAAQVNAFFITEDNTARIAAMWTQQAAGADRQFAATDVYTLLESDADGEFASPYSAGGLVDLRIAQAKATEEGKTNIVGALKVLEAYMIGRSAALWGDIPYSEAVTASIATPALDPQEEVYADLQALLTSAIADLGTPDGSISPFADMIFGGSGVAEATRVAKWRAAANSLKARYYIHWTEAQDAGRASAAVACGGNCWTNAAAAAAAGISNSANDMRTFHASASTESNAWYQFVLDRSGYVVGGQRGIDLLAGDPRLPRYYDALSGGVYEGSLPGENNTNASSFAVGAATRMSIITCAETKYIQAEEALHRGATAEARAFLRQGIDCEATRLGVSSNDPATGILSDAALAALSGNALLSEIIEQKYWANFLTAEPYNDWRRTCRPRMYQANGVNPVNMPNRLFYGRTERQTNPNVPDTDAQLQTRNENDPAPCGNADVIVVSDD